MFGAAGLRLRLQQAVPVAVDQGRRRASQLDEFRAHGIELRFACGVPQVKEPKGGYDQDDESGQYPVQQRTVHAPK